MMNLIRTQLWVSLGLNSIVNKKKRVKTMLYGILLIFALSPSFAGLIYMQNTAFRFIRDNNLPLNDMLLTGMYSLTQIMTLLLGIPMVYSALFQKNDLPILLPLPYRPAQILGAKLISLFIFELIACLAFFVPAFILNIIYFHPGVGMILNGIVSIVLLPVIPLAICTLLSLLVINIPVIGRNKWFWYMMIMVAILGVSFSFMMLTTNTGTQADVLDLVKVKMNQMNQTYRLIPGSIFGLRALVTTGFPAVMSQLLNLATAGGYLFLLYLAGQRLFLGPILRGDAVVSRSGRKQGKTLERTFMASYMRKELATTFKDPSVAMNALGGYIGLPMALVIWTIMKVQSKGKMDIAGEFMKMLQNPGIREYMPLFVIGIALFLTMLSAGSSMFSACYSKDGKRLWVEKTLPIHPFEIMKGKLYMGLIVVSTLNAAAVVMASFIVKLEPWQWIYIFILSEIVIAYGSLIALMIDCIRPKLVWKDTVQAVKQNMNVILAMLATTTVGLINAAVLYFCWKFKMDSASVYAMMIIFNAVLLIISWFSAKKAALRLDDVQV